MLPKCELFGVAALHGQAKQVADHGEDHPLAVGRNRHACLSDFRGLVLDGAQAGVILSFSRPGHEAQGQNQKRQEPEHAGKEGHGLNDAYYQ